MEDKHPDGRLMGPQASEDLTLAPSVASDTWPKKDEQGAISSSEMSADAVRNGVSLTRRKPLWRRRCLQKVALATSCLIGLNTGIALLLWQFLSPVTVSFDLTGTVNSFQQQMASQLSGERSLTDAQITAMTERFNQVLSESLVRYQNKHRAIILVSPAVVGGVKDITLDIQDDIAKRMKE